MLVERPKHISVCICTYRRPELLKRLLQKLEEQETDELFTFSIVVADNDAASSAEAIVAEFLATATIAVKYCVQPQQNISLTRNQAIENGTGDYIAFIDDDEFPIKRWLVTLFRALNEYKVDGVLGPVKRWFDETPPKWVIDGNFYERATYATGLVIDWRKGRTGNVLLKMELFAGKEKTKIFFSG
jgi:succinoglycan biosynthesis protein ExoM